MDDENRQNLITCSISKYRSPTYQRQEIRVLINLIEKYKHIILNKATSTSANIAKEATWAKIANEYDTYGFQHKRSIDGLKTKWENLKKDARKLSKSFTEDKEEIDEFTEQVSTMIQEGEHYTSTIEVSEELFKEISKIKAVKQNESDDLTYWFEVDKGSQDSVAYDNEIEKSETNFRITRDRNFSPQEISLLLKCIRAEKEHICHKKKTKVKNSEKLEAWRRVAEAFNSRSNFKRNWRSLRKKYGSMIWDMNLIKRKYSISSNFSEIDTKKNIKTESSNELKASSDDESMFNDENEVTVGDHSDLDPLSAVLNTNFETDHIYNHKGPSENATNNLKLQILKIQMESAKLEKKRIEDSIVEDEKERRSRELERALRLRAARLNAVAAAEALPSSHPALNYLPSEEMAIEYLGQFIDTPKA